MGVVKKTNQKVLLNKIFPARICDEICSYNLDCSKCKDLREKEYRYITYNQDYFEDEINSVAEKQIYVFKTRMEASPIDLSDNVNDRQMRREVDILMKNPTLKKGIFLQATKSYVKKNLGHTYQMLEDLHNIKAIKNSWMFPSLNRYCEFRNIDFRVKDLFKLFLREYTKELFKHYEHYINPYCVSHILNLGKVLEVVGATGSTMVSYILPGIVYVGDFNPFSEVDGQYSVCQITLAQG